VRVPTTTDTRTTTASTADVLSRAANAEALGSAYKTTWPRAEGSGPCGAASLWACPQQAVPLRPSPLEGRSVVPALDPDRANAMRVGMCRSNQFWGGSSGYG
jgi:hypothetical protein